MAAEEFHFDIEQVGGNSVDRNIFADTAVDYVSVSRYFRDIQIAVVMDVEISGRILAEFEKKLHSN